VRGVEPAFTGPSGRILRLRLRTAFGPIEMDTLAFRKAVGEDALPAAPLSIREAGPETVEFAGRGEGPGVGLCVLGAEEMAREGASWERILAHYFPGAETGFLPYRAREDERIAPERLP